MPLAVPAVVEELVATHKFLSAHARGAPASAATVQQQQCDAVAVKLGGLGRITMTEAVSLLETLQQGPWSVAQLEIMTVKVKARVMSLAGCSP